MGAVVGVRVRVTVGVNVSVALGVMGGVRVGDGVKVGGKVGRLSGVMVTIGVGKEPPSFLLQALSASKPAIKQTAMIRCRIAHSSSAKIINVSPRPA